MFGRATIRIVIGPHSSLILLDDSSFRRLSTCKRSVQQSGEERVGRRNAVKSGDCWRQARAPAGHVICHVTTTTSAGGVPSSAMCAVWTSCVRCAVVEDSVTVSQRPARGNASTTAAVSVCRTTPRSGTRSSVAIGTWTVLSGPLQSHRNYPRDAIYSAGISCRRVSVRPSVISRCSTETAKRKATQTTPHDSPGNVIFWYRKFRQNSNGVIPNGGAECRWGRLNAHAIAADWRLSTQSIVNLVPSQVYHT